MANYTAIEQALAKALTDDQPELQASFGGWSEGLIVQMLEDTYTEDEIVDALINLKTRKLVTREGETDKKISYKFANATVYNRAKTIAADAEVIK